MRLDPTRIGNEPRSLDGGALDAATGQQVAHQARDAAREADFESLDSLLLKRMRATLITSAATSTISASDASELAARTRQLMAEDADAARAAHGNLARERLRDLLTNG